MAGSNRVFAYETDDNVVWNVNLDESMGEQVQLGFNPIPSVNADIAGRLIAVNRGRAPISMRYANCEGIDQHGVTVKRKVYIGNIGAAAWQSPRAAASVPTLRDFSNPPTANNLTNVRIKSLVGEVRRFLPTGDTGINDGDIETYPV